MAKEDKPSFQANPVSILGDWSAWEHADSQWHSQLRSRSLEPLPTAQILRCASHKKTHSVDRTCFELGRFWVRRQARAQFGRMKADIDRLGQRCAVWAVRCTLAAPCSPASPQLRTWP